MKKILALSALAVCLNLTPQSSLAQESVSAQKTPSGSPQSTQLTQQLPFADARNMAVIVTYAPGGAVPQPSGSGVWVGKRGYVATCWHVVAGHPTDWRIVVPRPSYVADAPMSVTHLSVMIETQLVAYDQDTDVAILKANQTPTEAGIPQQLFVPGPGWPSSLIPQTPISPKGATLQTEFPADGQTLLLAGFRPIEQLLILQTGVATGFYADQRTPQTPPKKAIRIMLSLVSNPGNSGGPVIDAEGKVIGLLEGGLQSPIRDDHNRDMFYMRPKLDQNGSPMLDASGQPLLEQAPYLQNAGISLAVPARFIQELADAHQIKLD